MRVEIPEYNTTVEFPDDMAPEKIQEILAKEFPSKEQPSLGRQLLNLPGAIGRSLAAGAADVGTGIFNLAKLQNQAIANIIPENLSPVKNLFQTEVQKDIEGLKFLEQKAAEQDLAMQSAGNVEKGAYNIARAIPMIGAAAATGPVAPVTFGALAVGQYAREAEQEGASVPQQLAYGAIMGTVEGLTEKIPLGEFGKAFTQPLKRSLMAYLKSIPAEGIQEATSQIASGLTKQFVYKPDEFITGGQLDWDKVRQAGTEAIQAGATGMGTAALIGGAGVGRSALTQARPKKPIEPKTEIKPEDVVNLVTGPPIESRQQSISLEEFLKLGEQPQKPIKTEPIEDIAVKKILGEPITEGDILKSVFGEVKPKETISSVKAKGVVRDGVPQGKETTKITPSQASASIKSWPDMNKAGFTIPEETYIAFQAKSKGKEWFKKEFASLSDSDTVYNQLVQKVDSLSPRDRSKFNFDIQFFAKNNPDFSKAAKERLINLYGAIPRGEAPRLRNVDVPAATDEGKTRRFARTAYEILPKEAARQTMEDVMAGKFAYEPISNKETIRKAEAELNAGVDAAYQKWQGVLKSGKQITANDLALGEALLTKAARDKDLTKVSQLTIDLASELTNAGQVVQAARLLKKMSPEGYGVYVERQVKKANREFKQRYGDKFKGFNLTEADRKAILEAPTTEERERIATDIARRMAQEAPVSLMEKFNSWRRLMMLFNPRTHVRNIAGNAIFMPVRKATDAIGAGLEKVMKVPEGKRTKAVGWAKDSSLVKLVDESWDANKKKLTSSGRWDISQILGQEKRIFKTKPIESLSRVSKSTLEAEDVWFLRRAYRDALGQYLRANNLKTATDAAVNYATRRAQEATYRDASALANLLYKVKREGGPLGTAVEALMPFVKTPVNIARRGIEHSPIGLVRGLSNYFGKVKKGQMEATEAIEQLAKGLTGTGAMTLGIILAKLGVITGAEDEDLDKAMFDQAVGKQPFAVNIDGHYYTWDWAQPISLPVAMGAQVYKSIKENEGLVNSLLNSIASGVDVLLNLPLFQGVKRTLKGFALSPEYGAQSAANALFDIFDSYARQAVPVLGGQIARTLDQTIRTTYTPKGEKGILSTLGTRAQGYGKYVQSRTPGLSQKLPPKITTLGEKAEQPRSMAARAFLNFVSPGFYSKYKDSPAVKLVETVYKETGDKRIFPRVAPKTITVDNKKYILSAKEYSRFQQYIGQAVKEGYDQLAGSGSFAAETNENKVKIMKKVLDDAFDKAKAKLMDEKGIESVSKKKFSFGF